MNIPSKNKPQEIAEAQLDHIVGGKRVTPDPSQFVFLGPLGTSKSTRFNNTGGKNK